VDWQAIPEIQEGVDLILVQLEHVWRMGRDSEPDDVLPLPDLRSIAFFLDGIGLGTSMRVMNAPAD
jgi:hypothetical protein